MSLLLRNMSKEMSRSLSSKKVKKKKSSHNLKNQKSSLSSGILQSYLSRKEILEIFVKTLLQDIILSRESIFRPVDFMFKSSTESLDSQTSKEFKELEEDDFQQSTMVTADGSKLVMYKNTSFLEREIGVIGTISSMSDNENNFQKTESCTVSMDISKNVPEIQYVKWEKIIFKNGNEYEGPVNDHLMHGRGRFVWADHTVYIGEFVDGDITGNGEMVLHDLSKYEGDFCNGFFHGKGFLNIVDSPKCYYGEWKNGQKDGFGWILYEPGDWYEGQWQMDLRHGTGFRRYKNGSKYKGDWINNKKQGKGVMLLYNDDYYTGNWSDDKPHGYGEYTWDVIYNKTFCFPIYNWYKGAWKHGKRDGIGIMNFGTESGAKYAGTWRQNFKHGPGVMMCGNGLILESNPLFQYNKPIHKYSQISFTKLCENPETNYMEKITGESSYYTILDIIKSQTALSNFDENLLLNITHNSENIPTTLFINLPEVSTHKSVDLVESYPLNIPMHIIPEDIDLKYFVDLIFDTALKQATEDTYPLLFDTTMQFSEKGFLKDSLLQTECSIKTCTSLVESFFDISQTEERVKRAKYKDLKKIKTAIIIHLLELKTLYDKYACYARTKTGAGDVKLNFKPVLVRFFLWALLRDLHVCEEGVQLVNIDLLLWDNPACCLDTQHYPFEPIYFYQFVQYLMGAAWLTHVAKLANTKEVIDMDQCKHVLPSTIFRNFLDSKLKNIEMMRNSALVEYFNVISLPKLYDVYVSIEEPLSTESFLNATYRPEGVDPPCFFAVYQKSNLRSNIKDGVNAVPVAHDVYFINDPDPINKIPCESGSIKEDKFSSTLYTFRHLGKQVILDCMTKVCPKIWTKHNTLNPAYKLTFLEFFEIVVQLAYAKAEDDIRKGQMSSCKNISEASDISYKKKMKSKKARQ